MILVRFSEEGFQPVWRACGEAQPWAQREAAASMHRGALLLHTWIYVAGNHSQQVLEIPEADIWQWATDVPPLQSARRGLCTAGLRLPPIQTVGGLSKGRSTPLQALAMRLHDGRGLLSPAAAGKRLKRVCSEGERINALHTPGPCKETREAPF
ncbi:hypothetical protein SRHO_G00144480 [Serrasalmus rhombeus]